MIRLSFRGAAALALALVTTASGAAPRRADWIATWASAQQVPGKDNEIPPTFAADVTVRQVVHLSTGGTTLRVRFSNLFGTAPLVIDAAHVALGSPGSPTIMPGTDHALRFGGQTRLTLAPGTEVASDPVRLTTASGASLAVTIHLPALPAQQTGHPGARTQSFIVAGNQVAAADLTNATSAKHWFQLTAVEVRGTVPVIAAIGDSITDGRGGADDRNERWPDQFAARLRAAGLDWGVVNTGIGGNRILGDGIGPKLVGRFERDALDRPGVRYAIVLEGVNDFGGWARQPQPPERHRQLVADVQAAFRDMVARAHARGVKVLGGTILPFGASNYFSVDTEADRQAINAFIRSSGVFDEVVDFDVALRDPAHPERLLPANDSGDGLHPNAAGYRAMAAAVPVEAFRRGQTAEKR